MQDGSFESLDKAISKLAKGAKLISLIEVDVQFRDLSFWGQPSLLAALPLTHTSIRNRPKDTNPHFVSADLASVSKIEE
jgi:hypothetical protein